MRLSTEVLNEIIPNFLRDGWQVVSPVILIHVLYTITLFSSEHSRHRRSSERDHPGRVRERAQGHKRHQPAPETRTRSTHDEEGYGSAREARR